ncbi:MAG TPA: hypothetical protein VE173_03105, partial [Longimicrobiales bacterium]|nr:hypothetical protein [Longimicrobiales bacterium]
WTLLTDGTNGIPEDTPTRVVREDPVREGLLYAGTEFGMFLSFDNGAHWQSFQQNLPNVPINDIKVHEGDLVLATQGRAFWILDDLEPLRQIAPSTAAQQVQLYRPGDGYRTRASELLEPTIQYYLPSEPPGAVTIDILDVEGQVVNSYSSAEATGGRGGGRGNPMMQGRGRGRFGGGAPRVTAEPGLNRFVWNVQHQAGPAAPPGRYQARLTVAGESHTEPFEVLIDPRVAATGVSVADLEEQFEYALQVQDLVADVRALAERVEAAQERLEGATGARAETASRLEAVASELFTGPVRYDKPGLQEHIQYLSRMGLGVDQRVGRDAVERYEVLRERLDDMTARVDDILGTEGGAAGR